VSLTTLQLGFIVSGKPEPASGSERYYWDLVRSLKPLGVRVRGLVVGDPTVAREPVPEIESFAPEGGGALPRLLNLRREVARSVRQSDVIASHNARHAMPVLDVIRNRPLVVHFHGPLVLEGRAEGVSRKNLFMRGLAEKAVYRRARRLVVLSRAFGEILSREYAILFDRIRVVPGGVDLRRFRAVGTRADARRALGLPLDRPIVATVRRLAHTKGLEELIDAVDLMRRAVPDVLVVLAGAGPLEADLRARVAARGLERWIHFAGRVSDELLPAFYRAADLFVVPTVALEGFGLVVLEALACGTPALVTPVAGLPEVVADLDPGLIMNGATSVAIAAALADALSGRLPLPDEAACIAYAQRFDWPAIAARVREVYEEVA
jgi:glycosyltransferase involved in cell wall biosynthesis